MMKEIKLHTKSRDNLYEATATYKDGMVTVHSGSRINTTPGEKYQPSDEIKEIRSDKNVVAPDGKLLKDLDFNSLSTAASFVQGRIANGMISWKTEDGKYVRETLKK